MKPLIPQALKPGDTVAITSPAGAVNPDYVDGAAAALLARGYEVTVQPHAKGRHFAYSGTVDERLADITGALLDPKVRAVLCARGGYGCVHLLEALDRLPLRDDPKWLIGFSDVSALHALMRRKGIASVHASMARHLATTPADNPDTADLFAILSGSPRPLSFDPHPLNRTGIARGPLTGGNLAVIADLLATPFSVFTPGSILLLEDIGEQIYKVERILYQLRLAGVLDRLAGVIVGAFTDYTVPAHAPDMYPAIAAMLAPYSFPVAFGAPVGHIPHNVPLLLGPVAELYVAAGAVTLRQGIAD